MNLSQHIHRASYGAFLPIALTTTLLGCSGDEGDDGGGGSGGSESGGSTSGGAASGGSSSGGSETGGASSTGGDTSTGGQAIFGDACIEDSDCPMLGEFAGNCRTIWPAGYCTAGCNFFGDCGDGNVCDMGLHTCLKACDGGGCREGYVCSEDSGGCEPAL